MRKKLALGKKKKKVPKSTTACALTQGHSISISVLYYFMTEAFTP